jgi:hypothetical protein
METDFLMLGVVKSFSSVTAGLEFILVTASAESWLIGFPLLSPDLSPLLYKSRSITSKVSTVCWLGNVGLSLGLKALRSDWIFVANLLD